VEDRVVFDGGSDNVWRGAGGTRNPLHPGDTAQGEIIALGCAAGENYLTWSTAQDPGNLRTGSVNRGTGVLTQAVNARWIAKNVAKKRLHCRQDSRIKRSRRCVVEIHALEVGRHLEIFGTGITTEGLRGWTGSTDRSGWFSHFSASPR